MNGLKIDKFHPIRQKALWVGLIQWLAAGLALAGLGAEVVEGWAAWLTGGLTLLVLAGVLAKGATDAEGNTTPVDDQGDPLNLEYQRAHPEDRPA